MSTPDVPRDNHIEARGISKHFGGTRALSNATVSVRVGSVHALVGENGAGKSTLGKIIAGVLAPDEGQLLVRGEPVSLRSPREALEHGIATIGQEPSVVPQLSVAENVFLGAEPRSFGTVRRRALRKRYEAPRRARQDSISEATFPRARYESRGSRRWRSSGRSLGPQRS